jgi:hypothetical protein
MKKIVMTGLVMFFAFVSQAQVFKKGEVIEINKNLTDDGDFAWIKGNVVDIDVEKKEYTIRTKEKKTYRVPFAKEDRWMRKELQPLSAALMVKDVNLGCSPTEDIVKQKIKEEFDADFSEYDSVIISYNNIQVLESYKNTDAGFGKVDSDVHSFDVDFTVRLVSKNSDGTQRKINWQFKRKYLLYQNMRGKCSLSVAEKEENLLSNI